MQSYLEKVWINRDTFKATLRYFNSNQPSNNTGILPRKNNVQDEVNMLGQNFVQNFKCKKMKFQLHEKK
jgi:hypothetical protein